MNRTRSTSRLAALLLLLPVATEGCRRSPGDAGDHGARETSGLEVKAAQAARKTWPVVVPVTGSLRSRSIVEVRAEVPGRLVATHFDEGDTVRRDEVLAEIDPTHFRLARDQAAASLSVAQASLVRMRVLAEHAAREKERADNLMRSGGITDRDHQAAITAVMDADAQVRLAEAQCEQARAVLAIAEKALADCRIIAPIDGRVSRKALDRGTLVAAGATLYTLVDNTRLDFECQVPSYRIAGVRPGQPVSFTTPSWGDKTFEGTVSAVNPSVESDNRSVKVTIQTRNPGEALKSGMYANGEIRIRVEPKAMVIPRSALISEEVAPPSAAVYVVEAGVVRRRQVRVGGTREDRVWIEDGLAENDWIIVEIGPALKDGLPVQMHRVDAVDEP